MLTIFSFTYTTGFLHGYEKDILQTYEKNTLQTYELNKQHISDKQDLLHIELKKSCGVVVTIDFQRNVRMFCMFTFQTMIFVITIQKVKISSNQYVYVSRIQRIQPSFSVRTPSHTRSFVLP